MKHTLFSKTVVSLMCLAFAVSCVPAGKSVNADAHRLPALPAGSRPVTLLGRAIIPAGEYLAGPTSGQYLGTAPINNAAVPFVNKQPVQGVSAITNLKDGTFMAMSDNGFGNAKNSGDYILAVYHIRPNFETGSVEILNYVRLKDPNNMVDFPIKNRNTNSRYLTGADFDPESFQIAPDGTWWFGDEFGPFLIQTNSAGIVLQAPIMVPGVTAPENPFLLDGEAHTLPTSSGFEGMAISADGKKLYPMLERALIAGSQDVRIIFEFSLETNAFTGNRYYYPIEPTHMIGELIAVNENEFIVIERDGEQGQKAVHKQLYLMDKSNLGAERLVRKREIADLMGIVDPKRLSRAIKKDGDIGLGTRFSFPFLTVEAVTIIDSNTLVVTNDNNFPFSLGRNPTQPDATEIVKISLTENLNVDITPLTPSNLKEQRNMIFIHPDGTSQAQFTAARLLRHGINGMLNWDMMPYIAIARVHVNNSLQAGSVAGAVAHATGYRTNFDVYGLDRNGQPLTTLMEKAQADGFAIGLVNSGSITEPGTGAFIAQVQDRRMNEAIALQILEQKADVVLGGGEQWFLPENVDGRHGKGRRTDGRNLINEAKQLGYTVVYTAQELAALDYNATQKVLGLFAAGHIFNDRPESVLKERGLPLYRDGSPTLAEKTKVAIKMLSRNEKGFFLVVEEEGTDNFGNANNAEGTIEAALRADDAIGVALGFAGINQNTLVLVASDSDAGGFSVDGEKRDENPPGQSIKERKEGETGIPEGGPIDGVGGTGGIPFVTPEGFTFGIAWTTSDDCADGTVVRAYGLNAEKVRGTIHNVDIHYIMRSTLYGEDAQP